MLKQFFKKHGWRYIPGVIFMLLCSYVQTRAPLALGSAIELATEGDWQAFIKPCLSILWIAIGVFVTRFTWRWFVIRTSREMEVYLRDRLYTHLIDLPVGYFGGVRSGDLMAYAINDVNAVRMMFGMVVAQCINSLSSVIFSIGEMSGGIDASLTLYSLLPVPLAIFAVIFIGKKVRSRATRAQELFSSLSGHVQENINGMRVLKAFAQEKPQYDEYLKESDEKRRANLKLYFTSATMDPVIKSVFGISYAVGLIYGGRLVMEGKIFLADYIAFNSYLTMIVNPVVAIGKITNNLQRGLASYKRLKTLMDKEEVPEFDKLDDGKSVGSSIEFKNLSWNYDDESGISGISDISIDLKPGKMLGIVGPTGGGKTTILSLIMKLRVPQRGKLFIGGRDILDIPAVSLRAHMGYVPQDGFLFDETIKSNVDFFTGASEEKIRACLDVAQMTEDIDRMPEGLNTMCGERGNHLSGGQRQRVSLARALVREPDILLLDDTLSAVDAATEVSILKKLKGSMLGKTCVVVAHRLSAVENADEIIYIEDGRIKERGTHAELIARRGDYYNMWALQNEK